jgi:ketosteroid isomerase-like protein
MSQENVEIVRQVYEAAARRDPEGVFALYDPKVEWDISRFPLGELMGGGVYYGHEGLQDAFRVRNEPFENIEDQVEELIDFGDRVLSVSTSQARGRTSGADVTAPMYAVWTIRESKVIRVVWLPTREEALALVGLSE